MLLAEELLLQVTTPVGGILHSVSGSTDLGLAGALLSELALVGKIGIDPSGRLTVIDTTPTGQPGLDWALTTFLSHVGKKPKSVLPKVAKGLRPRVYAELLAQGAVEQRRSTILRFIPRTHWVPRPGGPQEATRRAIEGVLLGSIPPDPRTGSLVSLLLAINAVPSLFKGLGGLSGRELKARAKTIAAGNWAGAAVSKAIADVQAAVNAAVIAAVVASTAGAGAASS